MPCGSRVLLGFLAAAGFGLAQPAEAQPSPEWIRVAVVRDGAEVELQVHGPFTLRARHTHEPIQEGRRLEPVSVQAVPEGLRLGSDVLPYPGVLVEAAEGALISLNGQRLHGAVEIIRQENLTVLAINHVGLEDYLRGVLSKEAPDYWPPEALKAIAIAARTYALYQRFTKAEVDYDVTGDVLSQLYGGKTAEKHATSRAVDASEGLILTFQGQLFPAFYHSTCGGVTEHARAMGNFNVAPLQGGVVCELCSASPFYAWRRRLTPADIRWALRQQGHGAVGAVTDLRVVKRSASGRIEQLTIVGSERTHRLTGYEFRRLFGFERIRSPWFTVVAMPDAFILDGRGWGHGVGLCQWGAAELARRGATAREILAFYYPQSTLVRLSELAGQPLMIIGGP